MGIPVLRRLRLRAVGIRRGSDRHPHERSPVAHRTGAARVVTQYLAILDEHHLGRPVHRRRRVRPCLQPRSSRRSPTHPTRPMSAMTSMTPASRRQERPSGRPARTAAQPRPLTMTDIAVFIIENVPARPGGAVLAHLSPRTPRKLGPVSPQEPRSCPGGIYHRGQITPVMTEPTARGAAHAHPFGSSIRHDVTTRAC